MERRDLLARLAAEPGLAALLLDVDGTLAPIVTDPARARVPDEVRDELRRLHGLYALVACLTGRSSDEAVAIVGVPDLVYVGAHGLELHPDAEAWRERLQRFRLPQGWPVENRGVTVTLHYRAAADEHAARAELEEVADRARAAGLAPRFGRKVLELRPPVEVDKGTAVRELLQRRGLRRALYAGDDTTDVDAFRGLEGLELGIRVAVSSAEAPPELERAADVVLPSQSDVLELLRVL